MIQYEINGTMNDTLYTLTDQLKINMSNDIKYDTINIQDLKNKSGDTIYDTITVYVWDTENEDNGKAIIIK